MIDSLTNFFITSSIIVFGIALLLTLFRLIKGPTTADRVVAFDAASAILMSMVGLLSIVFGTFSFLDSILLIAIISFVDHTLLCIRYPVIGYNCCESVEIFGDRIRLLVLVHAGHSRHSGCQPILEYVLHDE